MLPQFVGMLLCIHNWMGPLTTEAVKVTYITLYVAMDVEITIANFWVMTTADVSRFMVQMIAMH